ncbi:hypothetical protein EMIT0158MI4_270036 [Burkholderia ambifaria]
MNAHGDDLPLRLSVQYGARSSGPSSGRKWSLPGEGHTRHGADAISREKECASRWGEGVPNDDRAWTKRTAFVPSGLY